MLTNSYPMQTVWLLFVLLLCNLLPTNQLRAQSTRLSSNVDSVEVGDVFTLNIKIQLNEQVDHLIPPDSSSLPPELVWMSLQQFKITDFADSLSITVQHFGNSDLFVPALPIGLITDGDTSFVYTNNLLIPFRTVLPHQDAELQPIKPIFEFRTIPWGWILLALALVAAGIWAYFTFVRKKEEPTIIAPVPKPPFVNPLEELENTLTALKNDYNLAQTQDFKYFYSTLSDSIRTYFEELYEIPALESTTRELLRFLDAFGVDLEMIKYTRSILNRSDMVKFAKFTPTLDNAWACHADALAFLERAKLIDAARISRKRVEYEADEERISPPPSTKANPMEEEH